MRDIYDPPPAPTLIEPEAAPPFPWTRGDGACLAILCVILLSASAYAWRDEPVMAAMTAVGGGMVVYESWATALGVLHDRRAVGIRERWGTFLAALVPWVVGIGAAASTMLGLFAAWDRLG